MKESLKNYEIKWRKTIIPEKIWKRGMETTFLDGEEISSGYRLR